MPKVKQVWKDTHVRTDPFGNQIWIQEMPNVPVYRVQLQLVSEKNRRNIGEIDKDNKCMFMKRERSKHYHIKMGGYGFNWHVINELGGVAFNRILFMEKIGDSINYFMFKVDTIKQCGMTKNFKNQGFELQTFLKYEYFEQFTTRSRMVNYRLIDSGDSE